MNLSITTTTCPSPQPSRVRVRACARETWTLTFRAADTGDPPTELRIRRLLKAALRQFGLRCIDYRMEPMDARDSQAPQSHSGDMENSETSDDPEYSVTTKNAPALQPCAAKGIVEGAGTPEKSFGSFQALKSSRTAPVAIKQRGEFLRVSR